MTHEYQETYNSKYDDPAVREVLLAEQARAQKLMNKIFRSLYSDKIID